MVSNLDLDKTCVTIVTSPTAVMLLQTAVRHLAMDIANGAFGKNSKQDKEVLESLLDLNEQMDTALHPYSATIDKLFGFA